MIYDVAGDEGDNTKPVDMVEYVQVGGDLLVIFGFAHIQHHVVQEVHVGKRPDGISDDDYR